MDVSFLANAFTVSPVVSVTLDTGKNDESGAHELQLRWRALAEQLTERSAPEAAIDRLGREVEELVEGRSPAGLVMVAAGDRLLLRHELLEPPVRDTVDVGPLPRLGELLRQGARSVSHLVITVDRLGGTIRRYGPMSDELGAIGETGEDWPIAKVKAGGWSDIRYQRSAENQWEANLAAVADDVNRLVQADPPAVIVLAGDVRARGLLKEHLSQPAGELVREIDHPGDIEPTGEVVWEQVLDAAGKATSAVLAEVRRAVGQGSDGAAGLDAVCKALQRSQVDTLVIGEDLLGDDDRRLWVGEAPTDVAVDRDALVGGAGTEAPAVDALLHAAVSSGAGVVVAMDDALPGPDCAATLRYADASADTGQSDAASR